MQNNFEIMRNCPLFQGIDDESLSRMLTCLGAKREKFEKRNDILSEGVRAKDIGIMISGEAQEVRLDYFGNRSIISEISSSEVFGEDFACAEAGELPFSVVATEPCEVMFIDCAHILHTCHNNCGFHQQLIYNLMKILASKTLKFHERIEITSHRTTREKLLAYLDIESKKQGKRSFEIPFDRQELADYLEVERSGLSAEISKLRSEGIIKSEKNRFTLL
jgi:CRP-like cAMP-binding protein